MRLLERAADHWAEGGPRLVAQKVFQRATGVLHTSIDFMVYRLGDLDVKPVVPPDGELVEMSMRDLLKARYFKALLAPDEMQRRFRGGETCLGLYFGKELGHVSWMSPGSLAIDRSIDRVPIEGAVGIYDMYTLDAFRGRGAQTAALTGLCQLAHQARHRAAVAGIYDNNAASRHVFEKVGFENIGTLRYRRTLWAERVELPELHLD